MEQLDFRALFERSPNPYLVLDRELRVVSANPAYAREIAAAHETVVGKPLPELFPADATEANQPGVRLLRESIARVLATAQPDALAVVAFRLPVETPEGRSLRDRCWSVSHTPVFGPNGEVGFVLQHAVDVTELRQARPAEAAGDGREQLRAGVLSRAREVQETNRTLDSELRHLRSLFSQAPGFVAFLQGPDHVLELANHAYYQVVGHRDILGRPVREALPELAGQGFYRLLDQVFTSGKPISGRGMKVLLQREVGATLQERYVDFIYQPIAGPDGKVAGIFVQGHDVTEQKRLEIERERLAVIVEQSGDVIGVGELDGRFVFLNEAGQRLLGVDGLDGASRLRMLNAFFPPDRAKVEHEVLPALEREGRWQGELSLWNQRSGMAVAADVNLFALSGLDGTERRGLALVARDITAQKRQEAERAQLLERERTAREEAERASRLKDDFLATVSHELRTPLTAVLGWVQMLRSGHLAEGSRERALETVERNARAQAQLIGDLLDVSRILAGKLKLEVERVNVAAAIEAALESVRPAAEAKEICIRSQLDAQAQVMGDPTRLQQVVWNLLANAVKFTPRGGRVEVSATGRDESVEIVVADDGLGIDPGFLPHVFERFRQADASSTRAHGGLGLGLSIVKHLVEAHGGVVGVHSEGEGRGASFRLSLPTAALRPEEGDLGVLVRSAALPPLEMSRPPQIDGLRVLVVDDEPDNRALLRSLLEDFGAKVETAGSAAEALARFVEVRPDVLVSDLAMPGEDGFSLIRKLRSEHGEQTPAVALSAYTRTEDRTRALLAGFRAHVAKPIEPAELVAVLASLAPSPARSGP